MTQITIWERYRALTKRKPWIRYLLILVTLFSLGSLAGQVWWWFSEAPLEQPIHLEAGPRWIQVVAAEAALKDAAILPTFIADGLWADVQGSFDALLMIDKLTVDSVSRLELVDSKLRKRIDLVESYPTTLSVTPVVLDQPCRIFLECCSTAKMMAVRRFPSIPESPKPSRAPKTLDNKGGILRFHLPKDRLFSAKFVDRRVEETPSIGIPAEFDMLAPLALAEEGPAQKLFTDSINTIVLSFDVASNSGRDSTENEIELHMSELYGLVSDGAISVGNSTRAAESIIHLSNLHYVTRVWPTRARSTPFDAALTLRSSDSLGASWMSLEGGAQYVYLRAPQTNAAVGNDHLTFGSLDRIQVYGELLVSLQFVAGKLPRLNLDGRAKSLRINDTQMLKTRWNSVNPNIQGALVGGIAGFLLSMVLNAWNRYRKNRA